MWFFTLGGSAVVPSILLFWYIHSRDIHPEPRGMLLGTFALGAATAIPVLIVVFGFNAVVGPPSGVWLKATWTAFLHAAIPEECFKYLVLMTFCWRSRHFDEPFDGIVYGATASIGFATLENVLYVSQGGLVVAIMRAFTAVPGHAFTGVVMGYFVGRAKFAQTGRGWIAFQGLLYAIVLHGLYDLFLMTGTGWFILSLPVLIFEIVFGILLIRRMRVDGFIAPVGAVPDGAVPYAAYGPATAAPAPYPQPPAQGQPPYAQPALVPPQYAQPQYAQPQYAQPQYAQPQYAQPQYAQPQYAQPQAPAPVPAGGMGKIITGGVIASVSALGALATLGALVQPEPGDPGAGVLVGIALVSVLGLAGGVLLFSFGLSARRPKPVARNTP